MFSVGFGAIDAALNAYAARHFGARQISWMHAGYGLGATIGPLLVTALLGSGAGWRAALASMAAIIAALALLLAAHRRAWQALPALAHPPSTPAQARGHDDAGNPPRPPRQRAGLRGALSGVMFTAVETGVESAAGIWGYVFLTTGHGLPGTVAGVAVSAYWLMMFAGRALLGPVAERAGPSRVLALAVCGIPAGAMLMTAPGPAFVAVAGMLLLGLAAAPVFPLLTLTTADRVSEADATAAVGLQVAASAVGSAALPSLVGLAIGAVSARALGPALLVLGLAMCAVYHLALRPAPRPPAQVQGT